MNAELLLEHYERITEAPDAIARLRRFVLDLAVRGKLVEQDPNDEPASKLVSTFQAERKIRIANKEMRNSKQLSGIDEPPFEIPASWLWLPLGETGNIFSGNSINESTRERLSQTQSGRPFIATKDVGYGLDELAYANGLLVPEVDTTFKVARPDTPLICSEGGSAGRKIGLCDREICFGNKLIANEPWSKISPRYVLYVYLSPFFYEEFRSRMTGVIGGISLNRFVELPFPLPPFEEQQRIVAKVDELMALCDQLETAQAEREGQRDKLTLSTLAKLNEPDPEAFAADARFALEHLEPLTKRTDQIKQLRQTILNLAVRGKLVEQDPNDEPASMIIPKIDAARNAMVQRGDLKRTKAIPEISLDETSFSLPSGWCWARLQNVMDVRDGTHDSPRDYNGNDGFPLITSKDFKNGEIKFDSARRISPSDHAAISVRSRVERDDILFSMIGGNIGNQVIVRTDRPFSIKNVALLKHYSKNDFMPRYAKIFTGHLAQSLQSDASGGAQPFVSLGYLRSLIVAVPPAEEQRRIIVKVDELMALCDQLEASLTEGEQTRSKLLEAVLNEALEAA